MKLQAAGSFCQSCYKFWAHQNLEPKRMVHVFWDDGRVMTTERRQIPIVICLYCDGDVIMNFYKENAGDGTG